MDFKCTIKWLKNKIIDLQKLTKPQLIKLLLKIATQKTPTIKIKPIAKLCKRVKQMVQDYEENIIEPPLEFRHGDKPAPRTQNFLSKNQLQNQEQIKNRLKKL